MSRSQETFNKKEREKKRRKKQMEKQMKKEERRSSDSSGLEIDWDSAPVNKTLTSEEEQKRKENKYSNKK